MPDHRLPKKLLFGELQKGKCARGAPKKRFKDSLKASLKAFSINPDSWEAAAQDRCWWRAAVNEGAKSCEANRTSTAGQRRPGKTAPWTRQLPSSPAQNYSVQGSARPVTYAPTVQVNPLPNEDEIVVIVAIERETIVEYCIAGK
jgi:hypothetical protein